MLTDTERFQRFEARASGSTVSPARMPSELELARSIESGDVPSDETIRGWRTSHPRLWFVAIDGDERQRLLRPAAAPEPRVTVHASTSDSKILGMKLDRLALILSAPVKPVYDSTGKIVAGERDLSAVPELPAVPEPAPEPKQTTKPRGRDERPVSLATVRALSDGVAAALVEVARRLDALEARAAGIEARGWQGVWAEGKPYRYGMQATHGGTIWFCRSVEPTTARPGSSADWQLMSKSPRDSR